MKVNEGNPTENDLFDCLVEGDFMDYGDKIISVRGTGEDGWAFHVELDSSPQVNATWIKAFTASGAKGILRYNGVIS